jgi:hypothetical protein
MHYSSPAPNHVPTRTPTARETATGAKCPAYTSFASAALPACTGTTASG